MPQILFKGKQFIQNYHLGVKFHELVPDKNKCRNEALPRSSPISLHDNLIVHGDNLKALKSLLPTYAGKVKCVYIDPPYNTGNEKWVYNDNVNSPMMKEWLGKIVDTEDLTRHEKWLCMMMPRLKLLRELLREDGVIFISIDDNEVHHLRMLMDEIFGEDNFVVTIHWRRTESQDNKANTLATVAEYILCYARSNCNEIKFKKLKLGERALKEYRYQDQKGKFRRTTLLDKTRGNHIFELQTPSGKIITGPFNTSENDFKTIDPNLIYWAGGKTPYLKTYLDSVDGQIGSNLFDSSFGTNEDGTDILKEVFANEFSENSKYFSFPKPVTLIQSLMQLATDKDSIILDSFAGSGTTAHAVLALNKEDGGNRKFILVECEDYADKITAERVRRVMSGVKNAKDENLKNGYGGSFSYFELGRPIELEEILTGKHFPSYKELARYIFFTATGEEFNEKNFDENKNFIGESKDYLVYLFYKPDLEYLRNTALTLSRADALGAYKNKRRLVFAPTKYLDQEYLDRYRIDFAQLPFEIYERAG
ncbi:MAG: site-specific DNA-methyltransferase [bacterium]